MKMAVSQAIANGYFQNKQWVSEFDYLLFPLQFVCRQFHNCYYLYMYKMQFYMSGI